jgi:acetyl esterase/lipase
MVNKTDAIDKRLKTLEPLNKPPVWTFLERIVFFLFNLFLRFFMSPEKHPSKRRLTLPALVKAHSVVKIIRRTDMSITEKAIPERTFDADWIEPEVFRNRYVLYLPGGGFFINNRVMHRPQIKQIADSCNARCLVPDYCLAPEETFPLPLIGMLSFVSNSRSQIAYQLT